MLTFGLRLKPWDIIMMIVIFITFIKFIISYFTDYNTDTLFIAIIALLLGIIYANLADFINRK